MSSQLDEAISEFEAFKRRPSGAAPAPEIRVNDVLIPVEAVLREAQNHAAADPQAALREAALALVVRELLLQEARRLALDAQPEQDANGRRETEEDALIRSLLEREVATPKPDEETCRRYYRNNEGKFCSDDIFEARHILIAADPRDEAGYAEARRLAENMITTLQVDPSRFPVLAMEHSACPSREQGGSLGQVSQGQTVPEFETFLFDLEVGQLCPVPVPTRFGIHVIMLDRKISGRSLDFDLVRERIADYLEAASRHHAIAQYIGILAGTARITGIALPASSSPLVQ